MPQERKIPAYADIAMLSAAALAERLRTNAAHGLSDADAARRLAEHGENAVENRQKGVLDILRRQFESPFIFLLLAAGGIALVTGETIDAMMIGLFTLINTALGFTQEYHAERTAQTLLRFWHGQTHALRGGTVRLVDVRSLVPGDIIRLQAGDAVPADVRFLSARGLMVNESVLTGESMEVAKTADVPPKKPADWYGASNIGFSGTSVLTGEAEAVVFATGREAALGDIATLAGETRTASSFEKEIASFSVFIMKLVVVTLAFMFALNVAIKGFGRIEELVLFSIALTIGVIPEALPVVSTIALSRGAMRMAEKRVIVKRLSAINDLGSIDILCTDKTGTITENTLHVSDVFAPDEDACLRHGLYASSYLGENERQQNNSFDMALWQHASAALRKETTAAKKIAEIPFDPVRRRNAALIDIPGSGRIAITRGSPEEILLLCGRPENELAAGKWLGERGLAGNRVIAVAAKAANDAAALDETSGFTFLGFIAFHDPIKPSSFEAARKARLLGVRIKILTGDSREVSGAVAAKLGLIGDPLEVIIGAEFDALNGEAQHAALERYDVFARMNPRQKFAVLSLLEEHATVGFLGEGFNDAPGLKMATVGLAVDSAADISKEAADVILQGKSLAVIFDGIEEGRQTFANTIKYLKITLASNFGNFYAVAVSSFFIPFLPMLPLQILLLNLLTDVPMIAIAADRADIGELQKPSKYDARHLLYVATVLGVVSSGFDFATFALFQGFGERPLQSTWFMVSALTELALIMSLRTTQPFWKATPPPISIIALAIAAGAAAVALPFSPLGASIFHFVRPTAVQTVTAAMIVCVYFVATETVKIWLYKRTKEN